MQQLVFLPFTPLRRLWLNGNRMDTFPQELCVLFPNVVVLWLENNLLRTLPARLLDEQAETVRWVWAWLLMLR